MRDLLDKALRTTIFIILWSNGSAEESVTRDFFLYNASNLANRPSLIVGHYVNKRELDARPKPRSDALPRHSDLISRDDHPRSYYSSVPAPPYLPAFDPISVLASLAFLAFLLQSFAALFDRTRSIIPTIISSRRSSSDYSEQTQVLRALEEYASFSNNLLDDEKESKKPVL